MDKLVGERSRLGVLSLGDLGDYYRQFYTITTFLRGKQRLSAAEQSRAFLRGFQPDLWGRISQRLQLQFPDHYPDDPYELDQIHEAAQYVLHGTPSQILASTVNSITLTTLTSPKTEIKVEDFANMFERMTESFVKALTAHSIPSQSTVDRPRPSGPMPCNYCGSMEHFIRECTIVLEDIQQGRCKRNIDGKVTLPAGAFVPRDIPGRYLKDRIDKWHRRNPG